MPIESGLSWEELAAIPESYATAWTCLHRNLDLHAGQTLVIRGATSALGQAALNIAAQAGAQITATTRNRERISPAARVVNVDAVLDLIGNSTVLDSLGMVRRGGRVCLAGFLGGLAPIALFNPLLQMASGVQWSFFGSFMFGTPEFPLSDVPLQTIVERAAAGSYKAKPARVFRFDEICEVHRMMESNQAGGKLVVRH